MRMPTNQTPTHAGDMLLIEFIKPLGIMRRELAEWIGVSYRLLTRSFTVSAALGRTRRYSSSRCSRWKRSFWLNLQMTWDSMARKAFAHRERHQQYSASIRPSLRQANDGKRIGSMFCPGARTRL